MFIMNTKLSYSNCHESASQVEKEEENEEEEDEEEDVDFNPFLKEIPSPEASSSLSSEIESLDGDVLNKEKTSVKPSNLDEGVQNSVPGDGQREEDIVMQMTVSPSEACETELRNYGHNDPKKRKLALISQSEVETVQEQDNVSNFGIEVNDVNVEELNCSRQSQKPTMDANDEDAICTRTRARYSLASFTLDELETFLQETDDDDDLKNIDDEEEYKKFLASVLQAGEGDGKDQENENVEDEDEDNDADFEIELEEALESDIDEISRDKTHQESNRAGRRSETRQNKRFKASVQSNKRLLGQSKRPLRPLIPILPNEPSARFSTHGGSTLTAWNTPRSMSSEENNLINGFTPQQLGQLYCLIHEHVQLLIQVFSLCVFDFSRQHIASQVQGLISEMLQKRSEVLAWRSVPYPSMCFYPPNVFPSVPNDILQIYPAQSNSVSCPSFDGQSLCSSLLPNQASSQSTHPDKEKYADLSQGQVVDSSLWVPFMSGPVLSILDVAPLNFVGRYINDVYSVVQEYRQSHVESASSLNLERESLFPLPTSPSFTGDNSEVLHRSIPSTAASISSLPSQQPPKKTLAATLVEKTKRQSVALVPKEIAKLANQFLSMFNPALFPHKPPSAAVVNRVLFTDAEDELLAVGMMEYNTDWKAIQQRFLPCKSKHQIFVRQKNRCSSKAPENPIKAVRRMKTSPLTVEEMARIQEGLKVFKSDWMAVWQFVVPHRDPSLLPRQWRIALGTQRSYKQDPATKEKRRLYESNRRKRRAANLTSWQYASEREDCESECAAGDINSRQNDVDNAGNAYVHEAFLADWRVSNPIEDPCSDLTERNFPCEFGSGEAELRTGNLQQFPYLSKSFHHHSSLSTTARHSAPRMMEANNMVCDGASKTYISPIYMRSYRARKAKSAYMVKLAPDLPPVNLPPSVRVVSQSAFKGSLLGAPKGSLATGSLGGTRIEHKDSRVSQIAHSVCATSNSSNPRKDTNKIIPVKEIVAITHPEEPRVCSSTTAEDERAALSDLHMHPLLFQAPDDGCLPYYPLNYRPSTSFSFFSGNQPQLNLSLFHNPQSGLHVDYFTQVLKSKEPISKLRGFDFHPLLQRTDDVNNDVGAPCTNAHVSVRSGSRFGNIQDSVNARQDQLLVSTARLAGGTKASSSYEKTNDLDLEINLSSTKNKEKVVGNRGTDPDQMRSTAMPLKSGTTMKNQHIGSQLLRESCQTISGKPMSSGYTFSMPTDNSSKVNVDDMDEHSHPEIVMEHEELSDSDEEIEENVEFECEEMADSEGDDGCGSEQIGDTQNKCSKIAIKESCHEGDVLLPGNNRTPSLELGLASQMKDDTSRTSWLSLDSYATDCSPGTSPKRKGFSVGEVSATKSLLSSPNKSGKKTNRSTGVPKQKNDTDRTQQLTLGKPRKRVSRSNTSLNIGLIVESSRPDGNDNHLP